MDWLVGCGFLWRLPGLNFLSYTRNLKYSILHRLCHIYWSPNVKIEYCHEHYLLKIYLLTSRHSERYKCGVIYFVVIVFYSNISVVL